MRTIHLPIPITAIVMFALASGAMGEVIHQKRNAENETFTVKGEAWQPDGFVNGTSIPAGYIRGYEITIDGRDNEPAWELASEVRIPLAYGETASAGVKALYSDEEVFIRVRWRDDDEDRQHHPWVWDSDVGRYVEGPQVEDSLLLSFEAGCEWTPSLLGGYIHDFDGWYWLAARSDPVGQALDLRGSVQDFEMPGYTRYDSRVIDVDWLLKFANGKGLPEELHAGWDEIERYYMRQPVTQTLYVWQQIDGARNPEPYATAVPAPSATPFPRDASTPVPQFSPIKRTGGAGEVAAKGHWAQGYWTVEFRRVRETPAGTRNDTIFDRLTQFSLHVFDHTEAVDESSESPRLFLEFLPEEAAVAGSEREGVVAER